jgi:hypothetical protein
MRARVPIVNVKNVIVKIVKQKIVLVINVNVQNAAVANNILKIIIIKPILKIRMGFFMRSFLQQ